MAPQNANFFLYQYTPSVPAAILFTVLFALTTALHGFQMTRTRTWFFIPFFCGGLCETVGYIGRTYSASQNPWFTLGPYVVQAVLLLVAPALFAASIYMELGKLSDLVAPALGLPSSSSLLALPRRWITRTFVTGDVICFLMQAGGASLMASDNTSTRTTGSNIVVGGLFVQIVFFGGFVITSLVFHRRVLGKWSQRAAISPPSTGASNNNSGNGESKNIAVTGSSVEITSTPTAPAELPPYARHLMALYVSSVLIFARSIVRAVEFIQGFEGYVISHEAFLYAFDAAPMFLTMLVFNWVHPSEVNGLLKGGHAIRGLKLVSMHSSEPLG